MFTGIIEEVGRVKRIKRADKALELAIESKKMIADIKLGESISVNGACLTVKGFNRLSFEADVMAETLKVTALVSLKVGDYVNLERAMRLGDRLGGHMVSGHIDGVGRVKSVQRMGNSRLYKINADESLVSTLILNGSVAIDGISLTVKDLKTSSFTVSIIPHTLKSTTLSRINRGDPVNIETDMMGKFVRDANIK